MKKNVHSKKNDCVFDQVLDQTTNKLLVES